MPKKFRIALLLVVFCGWLAASPESVAQSAARFGGISAANLQAGVDYAYVRTNAPPGGCGCFSLNGGAGWVGYELRDNLAVIGEVSASHATSIQGTMASLTFTTFTGGVRYSRHYGQLAPFGQLLLGAVHASGALTPDSSGLPGSYNAFAMTAGGGFDVKLSRYLSLRAVEADYFLTHLKNLVNDHQNNFRIGTGVIFRFR